MLQPGQDNVLPTRDGLDNVRREIELNAGLHTHLGEVLGDTTAQPVQVRLAWVTPQQRAPTTRQAIRAARSAPARPSCLPGAAGSRCCGCRAIRIS